MATVKFTLGQWGLACHLLIQLVAEEMDIPLALMSSGKTGVSGGCYLTYPQRTRPRQEDPR